MSATEDKPIYTSPCNITIKPTYPLLPGDQRTSIVGVTWAFGIDKAGEKAKLTLMLPGISPEDEETQLGFVCGTAIDQYNSVYYVEDKDKGIGIIRTFDESNCTLNKIVMDFTNADFSTFGSILEDCSKFVPCLPTNDIMRNHAFTNVERVQKLLEPEPTSPPVAPQAPGAAAQAVRQGQNDKPPAGAVKRPWE